MADNVYLFCEAHRVDDAFQGLRELADKLVAEHGYQCDVSLPTFIRLVRDGRPLSFRAKHAEATLTRDEIGEDDHTWLAERLAHVGSMALRAVEPSALRLALATMSADTDLLVYVEGSFFGSILQCKQRLARGWDWADDEDRADAIRTAVERCAPSLEAVYTTERRVHLRTLAAALLEEGADECIIQECQDETGPSTQLVAARRSNDPTTASVWSALSPMHEPAGFAVRVLEPTNPLVAAVTARLGFHLVRAPAT